MSPAASDAMLGLALFLGVLSGLVFICSVIVLWQDRRDQAEDHRELEADERRLRAALGYTYQPCPPGGHDWMLPDNGRSGYCLRCGAPFPLRDPRRAETAVIEAKADDGGRA